MTGLARAFLYAGRRGVPSRLWSVDEAETSRFMVNAYGGPKAGTPTDEAVQAAQLKMIKARKAPAFWAPVIPIGA